MDTIKRGINRAWKSVWAASSYTFSLLIGIIEFMAQNGSNIDFVHDIYFTFLARDFGMPADDYAVQKFIAHFAGKLGLQDISLCSV